RIACDGAILALISVSSAEHPDQERAGRRPRDAAAPGGRGGAVTPGISPGPAHRGRAPGEPGRVARQGRPALGWPVVARVGRRVPARGPREPLIVVDASVVVLAVADDTDRGDAVRTRLRGESLAAPEILD